MTRPPRFAIPPDALTGQVARISGSELHHMRDVMRLRPGAEVTLLGEDGIEYAGRIERFETDQAVIAISATYGPTGKDEVRLVLAAALIKGPRMDFLVEKAAELGAAELWPLLCARSVARNPGAERLRRWRRLALTAAKQSLAPAAMEIRPPLGVSDMIRNMPKETLAVICDAGAEPLAGVIRRAFSPVIILACGPEGDFDSGETAAMKAAGFVPAALGRNRLRSETAALAALGITAGSLHESLQGKLTRGL
jgi:16S rRNA (uracil1498-N3)-methyltransferase